jgi:hypothetical protein
MIKKFTLFLFCCLFAQITASYSQTVTPLDTVATSQRPLAVTEYYQESDKVKPAPPVSNYLTSDEYRKEVRKVQKKQRRTSNGLILGAIVSSALVSLIVALLR